MDFGRRHSTGHAEISPAKNNIEDRERPRVPLTPEILALYGVFENPAEPLKWRDILAGARQILNKRVYGFNKRPRQYFAALFPLLERLRHYRLRWVPTDLLAGLIVGMMQFTQVLGNSQTASLKPQIGLSILFYPGLVYALMASSMHNSVGGMCVTVATLSVSLINVQDVYYPDQIYQGRLMTDQEQLDLHSTIAPGIALIAGIVQIVMGLFKLGFLSAVISPNVLTPFTMACFLQSICGKIPSVLGIDPPVHFTYAKHFTDLVFTFKNINQINGWEVLMSASMAAIVISFREFLQPRIFQLVKVVIPIEFLLFVAFTGLSYALDLEHTARFRIVGTYEYGLQTWSWPNLSYGWDMAWSGVVVGLIAYSTCLESAKVLARRSEVPLSANQELMALGTAHVFSSFFSCYPVSASLGRGLVNESMGSQSQLSTVTACVFAGLIVGLAGPAIRYLPVCAISANMILFLSMSLSSFKELPNLWRANKVDGAVWFLTFVGCITLNVQIGLFVGIGLSMLGLIVRSQKPKVRVMGILKHTQWGFVAVKHYDTAHELPGVRILQLQSPLIYATADYLVKQIVTMALEPYIPQAALPILHVETAPTVIEESPENSQDQLKNKNPAIRALASSDTLSGLSVRSGSPSSNHFHKANKFKRKTQSTSMITALYASKEHLSAVGNPVNNDPGKRKRAARVVLDLGSVGYIDSVGIRALEQIASDLKGQDCEIILAQCTGPLLKQLKELEIHKIIPERNVFPSVVDAVEDAIRRNQVNTSPAEGVVGEYDDERFWDAPVVPVEGLPVVDYHQD
ncbi:Solute carrier family 26 member 6 [Hypsibius exemplaris]|uniref:Solute carrier family 26 member 6 n=1 Tax=Hypsibius exemplaris TaxID=2072580 RepID=A0A1W0X2C6_HYPEX|nr:Solute carrier family 26 member 6 [Hypsibius exemplaris]